MNNSWQSNQLSSKEKLQVLLASCLVLLIFIAIIDGGNYFFSLQSHERIGYPISVLLPLSLLTFLGFKILRRLRRINDEFCISFPTVVLNCFVLLLSSSIIFAFTDFRVTQVLGKSFGNYIALHYFYSDSDSKTIEDQFLIKKSEIHKLGDGPVSFEASTGKFYLKKTMDGERVKVELSEDHYIFELSAIAVGFVPIDKSTETNRFDIASQVFMAPLYLIELLIQYSIHFVVFSIFIFVRCAHQLEQSKFTSPEVSDAEAETDDTDEY